MHLENINYAANISQNAEHVFWKDCLADLTLILGEERGEGRHASLWDMMACYLSTPF